METKESVLDNYTVTNPKGKYLYETHCHTNLISACSSLSPEEMVELYAKNGYTGVFVTDHFLNGNCLPEINLTFFAGSKYLTRVQTFWYTAGMKKRQKNIPKSWI